MSSLVIGNGQIGSALAKVLGAPVRDIEPIGSVQADTLHICFPWFNGAAQAIDSYVAEHGAKRVVIHSTFPVGAYISNPGWLCSPVRGRHPDLEDGIRTFVKHVGGRSLAAMQPVLAEFEDAGLSFETLVGVDAAATLALSKLVELAEFGVSVAVEKETERLFREYGFDHSAYREFQRSYNDGYETLGERRFVKPSLVHMPGPDRGHCVSANTPMLPSKFFNVIVGQIDPKHWGHGGWNEDWD